MSRTNRRKIVAAASALATVLLHAPEHGFAYDRVPVAVAGPITAPTVAYGAQLPIGAEQTVEGINATGSIKDQKIQILLGDNVSDPMQGVSILVSDIYNEAGILQIIAASTGVSFTERGLRNMFTCGRDYQQVAVAATYLSGKFDGKKVAIIDDKTPCRMGLADEAVKAMNARGLMGTMYEAVNTSEKDVLELALKMRCADVVLFGDRHTEAGTIICQMRDENLRAPQISYESLVFREFVLVGEGKLMTLPPDSRKHLAVVTEFRVNMFGSESYTRSPYAAPKIMAQVALVPEAVGSFKPKKMSEYIDSNKTSETAIGTITYDKKSDVAAPNCVVQSCRKDADGRIDYADRDLTGGGGSGSVAQINPGLGVGPSPPIQRTAPSRGGIGPGPNPDPGGLPTTPRSLDSLRVPGDEIPRADGLLAPRRVDEVLGRMPTSLLKEIEDLVPQRLRDRIQQPVGAIPIDPGTFPRQETPGTPAGGTPPIIPTPTAGVGVVLTHDAETIRGSLEGEAGKLQAIGSQLTLPALPAPRLEAGSNRCIAPPPGTSIPSDDEFLATYVASVDETGTASTVFCHEGFGDVVLIDTGRPGDRICSGVVLRGGRWVLTAKHCVDGEFQSRGRVHVTSGTDEACLRRWAGAGEQGDGHPGESCRLSSLGPAGPVRRHPKLDIALVPVNTPSTRSADIRALHDGVRPLVTFAGFGSSASLGVERGGTLGVGWARAFWGRGRRDAESLPVIGVSSRERAGTVACGGDSGGPVFLGRAFGYGNERHELFGLSSERRGDPRPCDGRSTISVNTVVVPLQSKAAVDWLCSETSGALTVCRAGER